MGKRRHGEEEILRVLREAEFAATCSGGKDGDRREKQQPIHLVT